MDIPVYLIAGFLDAGKTSFINGILQDGFAAEDRTLLLCCEEGETAYDPKVLGNVFTYTIDEPEQMTPELFKKLEKQYRPKQVIIEYNGMWAIEPLYREGLPANWILYQIMCLVDANTFEPYVRNMGQLMMEKISNADLLIFNRCNEELRAQLRSRNLKMVNRRADIYLENADGTSEEYMTPDMSPFDLSSGHLDVPDGQATPFMPNVPDIPLSVPMSRAHVVALLEALEELLRDGYRPGGDLFLALSMDGLSGAEGARAIEDYLQKLNIKPCFVLDYGGYATMESFRSYLPANVPLALIGVAEKGLLMGQAESCPCCRIRSAGRLTGR